MAHRLTDSRKWDDPWFRELPPKYKCFWWFLLDKCDHAGIWKVDFKSAEFHIGEKIEESVAKEVMNGRIKSLGDKWFIPKFIEFQYKCSVNDLDTTNKVHLSVLSILKKEGVYKGLASPMEGAKDKDKDKDIVSILKTNSAYAHIDIDTELGKMDAWLLAHKGRQKTKKFIVNWLNKIEKPLSINKPKQQPTYKAPDEKERFKFVPEVNDLLKKLNEGVKNVRT